MAANPFAGLKTASISGSGSYLDPAGGEYVLKIENIMFKEELQSGGQAMIVDLEVIESTNPKDPPGSKRNWFQAKNASFGGAVLEFLYAVLKVDYKQDQDLAAQVQSESPELMQAGLEGKFNGTVVRCTTKHKITKAKQKPFTVHSWSKY
jgi:hypothetical protein